MKSILIISFVSLAIGYCIVTAEEAVKLDEVDPKLEAELRKLAPEFVKLSEKLDKKLHNKHDHEENLNTAKKMLKKATAGCLGACIIRSSWVKALELYVSMESTYGKCDTLSYKILYKNYMAILRLADKSADVTRAADLLDFYRWKRFDTCRNLHSREFARRSEGVPANIMAIVGKTFHSLDIPQLIAPGSSDRFEAEYVDLLEMPNPRFSQSVEAQRELARQVLNHVKSSEPTALALFQDVGKIEPNLLRPEFDKFLFEPCKIYRQKLGVFLNEARFDAIYNTNKRVQRRFFNENEEFYRAMINNRLCRSLLEEREKLYEPLAGAWNGELHSE